MILVIVIYHKKKNGKKSPITDSIKLKKFIMDIFKIIFESRNKLSEFTSQSRESLNRL